MTSNHLEDFYNRCPSLNKYRLKYLWIFIEGLPKSRGKSVILVVVVDRMSKYSYIIPLTHPYTVETVAQLFFEHVFKLHGILQSIVCDRDPIFTSNFWVELFRLQGTSFNFSSANHPQTNGQTEVVN